MTSTTVTRTRKKAVETAGKAETTEITKAIETLKVDKGSNESKDEYPENLAQVPYIWYPITFQKKFVPVSALFDLGSKVNAIHLTFVKELGLPIRSTDVKAQKIDGTTLDTFGMVVTAFSVIDKANPVRFFKKSFLVVNISLKVVLGISFLTLRDANVNFLG